MDTNPKLTEALKAHFAGVVPVCGNCGTNSWNVAGPVLLPYVLMPALMPTATYKDKLMAAAVQSRPKPLVLEDGVPVAILTCRKCLNVMFFAAKPLLLEQGLG